MATTYNLGSVSSYAIARQYGFTGTEAEWVQAIINASGNYDAVQGDIEELALQIPLLDSTLTYNDRAATAYAVGEIIRRLESLISTPLTASTVAGMTDTTKVYVYTGSESGYASGSWYYYNGSAWVVGGVYSGATLDVYVQGNSLVINGGIRDGEQEEY